MLKRNPIDLTKLLDGTEYGMLKVRVFSYLNESYIENPPKDLELVDEKLKGVFQLPEVQGMAHQWYKLAFK